MLEQRRRLAQGRGLPLDALDFLVARFRLRGILIALRIHTQRKLLQYSADFPHISDVIWANFRQPLSPGSRSPARRGVPVPGAAAE